MGKSLSNSVTLFLALVGFVIATWLTIEHFLPQAALPCGTVGDCHGTLASDYGHLGPIPTAAFGAGMYALLSFLCFLRRNGLKRLREEESARASAYATAGATSEFVTDQPALSPLASPSRSLVSQLDAAIWVLAAAGVGISWWLQYTALFVLMSFCPWCMTSALIVTLIFLLASRDFLIDGRNLTGEQKMLAGVLSFISVMMLFMVVPSVLDQLALIARQKPTPVDLSNNQSLREVVVKSDMHVKGPANAKYILVEFADYQCPACHDAVKVADDALAKNPDIRLAFRNFPLPMHPFGKVAASVAEAAALQGKFWEMHDYLYAHQDQMKDPSFTSKQFEHFAAAVGLNVEKFKKDVEDTAVLTRVETDLSAGQQAGVTMTPSFFVVSPKSVWRFSGKDELIKALADRNHPMWK